MASIAPNFGGFAAGTGRTTTPPAQPRSAPAQRPAVVSNGIAYDRLMLVMLLFAGAILLIGGRLVQLQISGDGSDGRTAAAPLPERGDIVDRNGVVMARTIPAWAIGVHPGRVIGNKVELAARLNELMPEHSAEWYLQTLNSGASFTYLLRRAEPELVQAVNALGEPGISFGREAERLYPQGAIASHLLGGLGTDGHGIAGIERNFDQRLTADAARGQPMQLSIDSRVQAIMEEELQGAIQRNGAIAGSGIILDVETGELLAMASGPTFDPNVPAAITPESMRNNATLAVFELGSVFKPLTMAAALDAGVTTVNRSWDSSPVAVGNRSIRDSHPVGRALTVPEILTHSSNTATARIADAMGAERMQNLWRSLHFHERMPLEIRERAGTLWPRDWGRTVVMTTGFGHGIAVTPLHLAGAYAALVNGGVWRPTTLLRQNGPVQGTRIFSEHASEQSRQMLRLIVTNGTGRRADVPGFRVGGKTGTAERPTAHGYSRSVNVSTFVAAFPMERPRYVVLVMLDSAQRNAENSGQTTAAYTAAPVVRNVVARAGTLLGVIPDMNRDIDVSTIRPLVQGAQED